MGTDAGIGGPGNRWPVSFVKERIYDQYCNSGIIFAICKDALALASTRAGDPPLLLDLGTRLVPIEIKASETPSHDLTAGARKLRELNTRDRDVTVAPGLVIYGGDDARASGDDHFVPWHAIDAAVVAL